MKKLLKITFTLIFTTILLLGFALPLNQVGNWYQQFMPSSPGGQIRDIFFVDSLLGFAVSDSSILKTTNSGDNWSVKQNGYYIFRRIHFLNSNIGYACAGNNKLLKTINSGENWIEINLPDIFPFDMSVVSEDSIWLVNSNGLTGGVFRTTNGGVSWDQQLNIGSQNPTNIYFYDKDTGFAAENVLYKTTNSGVNWTQLPTGGGFSDMFFVNALTGWKADGSMKKTTDGGLNWVTQVLPQGGIIITSQLSKFSKFSKDTIFGVGGLVFYGAGQFRGVIFKTTNGGNNWLFQVPDTAIHSGTYSHVQFLDKLKGWAYWGLGGVHTISGGDTNITGIIKINGELPIQYQLYQNYPNPFNPKTRIKYQITSNVKRETSNVKLIVFDITGREISILVNAEQQAGTYEADFSGNGYASGIYFYSLMIDGTVIQTRKMILIK